MFRKISLKKMLPYFVAFAGLALSFVGLVFWTFFVPDPAIWTCHLDDWESCYEDKDVYEEILMILALFVTMVFHLLLCYGFIKKRPKFVIPWMVLNVIFFAYMLGQVSNFNFASLAESFYYVNYGSSIIASKVRQIISVMKTKHSREMMLQK